MTLVDYKRHFIFWETIFDEAGLRREIEKKEKEINESSFWDNNPQAQSIFNALSRDKKKLETLESIRRIEQDVIALHELMDSDSDVADDADFKAEHHSLVASFSKVVNELEMQSLLSGPYDANDAIVSLYAGAGGTDAQDWVAMLVRMYTRWFDKHGFSYSLVEQTDGEEAGIKSVTFLVSGDYVYGLMNQEQGVHRLVRQSPFNANNKRQTSFAALDVVPQIESQVSEIEIDSKELRIDTFRASGAGGQHVNKTDSAVRITHIPTGIVATSQVSRSQNTNKETAMTILVSRLSNVMKEQQKEELSQIRGVQKENAWGNQIRSYVLHPYKLVKDLRTQYETAQVQHVLDGDIDEFIWSSLRFKKDIS